MEHQIRNIPVNQIEITGHNDRSVFNQQSLHELAESIKIHGILQNLTVRKNGKPDIYQLITGERRYRAAQIAGLTEVPCKVLELSDEEFKEVMLIENVQREDIHALDEAASFLKLLNTTPESAIALKIGKPVKYIKERIALNNLTTKAKELFRAGTMQLGHALVLCLFQKQQQNQVIEQVINLTEGFKYFDHPQDLKEYVKRHILCTISKAIFDPTDKDLLPAAGACVTCSKQSGANAELFATLTAEATCTDPVCFAKKTNLFVQLQNKKLLQQLNLKRADCVSISHSTWSYEQDVLNSSKWRAAKKADDCPAVTIGFLKLHTEPERALLICTDKKCKVHFKGESTESTTSIPQNEKPSDTLARRLLKRRERETIEDYHTARKQLMDQILKTKSSSPNEFELTYLVRIMAGRGSSRAFELARSMGLKYNEDDNDYYMDWINDLVKLANKSGNAKQFLCHYLRALILGENLQPESKYVSTLEYDEDLLRQHGASFGLDINPLLQSAFKARKETHLQEDQQVKDLKLAEREKVKKVNTLFRKAEKEYPELHAALQAKNKQSHLQQLPLETLSRMAFRIGLKRRKDGTVQQYASEIATELKSRQNAKKGAK